MEGRWQGRWTLNINIQECYWPVESTNLPRINESLVLFAEQLAQAGARTAKEMFGCRGWVAHHGTDVWFNTAPTDGHPNASMWPMGGAWIMQQLYDHYLYEPDSRYLNRIYPLLKGSADFFLDALVVDPATGWLVTNPSSSPENWFLIDGKRAALSMGSAMDIQIVRNLFRNCLSACKTLNRDSELQNQLEKALAKLPPHQIGKYGQLQEWLVDFDEADQRHRHLSHLFAAYPDDDISIFKTPELAKAVSTVLQRRGDTRLGWSGAWKINLHARLLEPEPAYDILKKMLTEVSLHPRDEDSRITPSFEGNQAIQGVTAGITELLMQSHSGELLILPALPAAWKSGTISGLRARGGYTLDITWEDGRLKESTIVSKSSAKCRIRTKVPVAVFRGDQTISATKIGATVVEFVPEAGIRYKIVPE
jgi:alpha-L-fucosidase 2